MVRVLHEGGGGLALKVKHCDLVPAFATLDYFNELVVDECRYYTEDRPEKGVLRVRHELSRVTIVVVIIVIWTFVHRQWNSRSRPWRRWTRTWRGCERDERLHLEGSCVVIHREVGQL